MAPVQKYVQITTVDTARREVWGILASETPDGEGEIFDYPTSAPLFRAWSEKQAAVTANAKGGPSRGNIRVMHRNIVAGKLLALECDDAAKTISVGGRITDDVIWDLCEQGILTGWSLGGNVIGQKWLDPKTRKYLRYTVDPFEASLVDVPANPESRFTVVKMDGSREERAFKALGDLPGAVPEDEAAELPAVTPTQAAEETIEDSVTVGDPMAPVPTDALQRWHNYIVALGARCDGVYPMSPAMTAFNQAAGIPDLLDPLPANPLEYILSAFHAELVECGARCIPQQLMAALPNADDGAPVMDAALKARALKAGARHSAADQLHVQGIHDHAASLGAACTSPDAVPAPDNEAVSKTLTDPTYVQLQTEFTALKAQFAALTPKADPDPKAPDQAQVIADLTARLLALEAQPVPNVGPALTSSGGTFKVLTGESPDAPDAISGLRAAIAAETDPSARQILSNALAREQLKHPPMRVR